MTCQQFKEEYQEHLSPEMQAHAESCPACRAFSADCRGIKRLLQKSSPALPADLWEKIRQKTEVPVAKPRLIYWPARARLPLALAAGLLLALGVLFYQKDRPAASAENHLDAFILELFDPYLPGQDQADTALNATEYQLCMLSFD